MQSMQENITHTQQESRSALRVAIARAVHQLLDEPIVFDDPLALSILGPHDEKIVCDDPFQFNDPPSRTMRAAIVARSRLAEDKLKHAVNIGIRQYVVLGAGLDTFSLRNPYQAAGLKIFEVDHPTMQQRKRAILAQAAIPVSDSTVFVPVDFSGDSLADQLKKVGFRTDEPACFSWLGVAVYLSNDVVLDTLSFVAKLPRYSSITFDYRVHADLLHPIEKMMEQLGAASFAELGEPWISSFDPDGLQRQLRESGFTQVEHYGPMELNARYFPKRKDGLQTGGGGFRMLWACV